MSTPELDESTTPPKVWIEQYVELQAECDCGWTSPLRYESDRPAVEQMAEAHRAWHRGDHDR